jgi:hypothetical protein
MTWLCVTSDLRSEASDLIYFKLQVNKFLQQQRLHYRRCQVSRHVAPSIIHTISTL